MLPALRWTFGSSLLSLALLEHEQVMDVDAFRPIQYHHHDRTTKSTRTRKKLRSRTALSSIFDLFDENRINNDKGWDGDKVVPRSSVGSGYNNNWLMFFHNKSQNEKQSTTNNLATWNEELQQQQQGEYEKIIEWQDSFHRNGLSDFCPPMSASLNCLMVGNKGDDESSSTQLPWEEEAEAEITSLRVLVEQKGTNEQNQQQDVDTVEIDTSSSSSAAAGAPIVRTSLVAPPHSSSSSAAAIPQNTKAAVYDCIVDHGLLEAVIGLGIDDSSSSSSNQQAVRDLVFEAATAIREHGIYVLVTQTGLSPATKQLLENASLEAGLEWAFELDGISDDHQQQFVSVARRFNTGVMPKVGKLSRFQP